ncbi:MAG TPA: hypothetical protein VER03_04195 [Bryobacteraceae bacterium]|nr:hypothetical protein [Bryobacteraceae bacterium]
MKHPGEQELSLYSRGDLGVLSMWRVGLHLRSCMDCAREVAETEAAVAALRVESAKMPERLNWDRLAAEMTANIHLGLEAGECVGPAPVRRPERVAWRPVVVMAGISALLMGAWWLNPPRVARQEAAIRRSPVEVRTAPEGLELKENGSAMILLHTRGEQKPIIVSTPGALRSRFVDEDTGQVTINNVYSD